MDIATHVTKQKITKQTLNVDRRTQEAARNHSWRAKILPSSPLLSNGVVHSVYIHCALLHYLIKDLKVPNSVISLAFSGSEFNSFAAWKWKLFRPA